jgi:hypothetical protein
MFAKAIFIFVLSTTFIFSSCGYKKYADAIKEETRNQFDKDKNYIYRLSFEGLITEKKYCKECEVCNYKLMIKISQLSEKPNISNAGFPPYYTFENDSLLSISVSKELYQEVKEKDKVNKENESYNLKVGTHELLYLNKEKYEWLP